LGLSHSKKFWDTEGEIGTEAPHVAADMLGGPRIQLPPSAVKTS
jgi:hypothetical protein